jgi:hypothetical protein
MRRPALAARAGLFALLCAAPAIAQSVWIVDDGGGAGVDFTDIPAAVAAAGEGDLILVRDGFYSDFTIDAKSLTVLADAGHHPLVSEPMGVIGSGFPGISVINLAAGAGIDPVTETYAGEPGDLVYLLWSYTGQMPPFFLGIEHGSFVIDVSTLDGQAVGTVGPSGTLVVNVPPLALVGLDAFSFACQASFFQAGGGFFLSSPSLFTLLGAGF